MSNKKELTVAEIKETLTSLGLEFDDKSTKKELLEILNAETVEVTEEKETVKYIVVHDFRDVFDGRRVYTKGSLYPSENGETPTEERIKELSTLNNKMNRVLIKEQV